jgi:hypothetical protein
MTRLTQLKSIIVLAGLSGSFVWAGDGVISRVPDPSGSFCHLRFPAIREDTLFSDQPILKDPSEGDIIDAYGPCDSDPLGKDSLFKQRLAYRFRLRAEYGQD